MSDPTPPRGVQLSRVKGWRMPPNTIKVDRSTPWGNVFIAGDHGTRAECVQLLQDMLDGHGRITSGVPIEEQRAYRAYVKEHIHTLRGFNLACWCGVGTPCHRDILIELANRPDGE